MQIHAYSKDTIDLPAKYFLQSRFWAEFKKEQGWTYVRYKVTIDEMDSFALTVLLRSVPIFGLCAYIPMGPSVLTDADSCLAEIAEKRGSILEQLAEKLVPLLPSGVFCIRFDPPWGCTIQNQHGKACAVQNFPLIPRTLGKTRYRLTKAASAIQPPDTVQLDLQKSLDILLDECKQKWRYNIRLAQKKGVKVRCLSGDDAESAIPLFYRLYQETAVRDGIAIHTEQYYRSLCRRAADKSSNTEHICISVYTAYFEQEPIAAIITLFSLTEAVYLYGASANEHRNLMPAYLLQWQAIQDAKQYGCLTYDFYGIPPTDDPRHPMHGLFRFKTGFGGTIIHRVGTLDIPVRAVCYYAYTVAEKIRSFWYKTLKKKFRAISFRKK